MSAIKFWPVEEPLRPQLCAWAHDESPSDVAPPAAVPTSGSLCFASPASASAALARVFARTPAAAALRAAADAFAVRAVEYLAQQRAGGGSIHAGILDGVARATSAWLDAAASWAATRWPYALIEPGGASSDGDSENGGGISGSGIDVLPPELTVSVTVDLGDAHGGGSPVSTTSPQLARSTSWSAPAGAGSSVWGNGGDWGGGVERAREAGRQSPPIVVRHGGIAYASVVPMRSFAALVAPGVSALRDPHIMMVSNPHPTNGETSVEQSNVPRYPAPAVARAMLAERLRHLRAAFRDAPMDAAAAILAATDDQSQRETAEHAWRAPVVVETDLGAIQNPFFFQTAVDTSGFSSDDADESLASIPTRLSWDGIAGPLVIEKGAAVDESGAPPNWARLVSELVVDGVETDAPQSWDACVIAPSGGLPGEAIDAVRCDLERRVFRNSDFCVLSSTPSSDDAGEDIYTSSRLRGLLSATVAHPEEDVADSKSRARPLDAPPAVRHPLTRSIVAAELACAVSRHLSPSPADALAALVAAASLTERALSMGARGALGGEAGGGAVGADDFLPSIMWLILHEQEAAQGLASTLSFLKRFRPNLYGKEAYVLTSINAALFGLLRMASH